MNEATTSNNGKGWQWQDRNAVKHRQDSLSEYVFGKQQPQAIQLEIAVLGAILIDKEAMPVVSEILNRDSFYSEINKEIYAAMQTMYVAGNPIDLLTVTEQLRKAGKLEFVGGAYHIVELSNRVASAANIEYHCRIIRQKEIARDLIKYAGQTMRDAYEETKDVFDVLEAAEQGFFQIRDFGIGSQRGMAELGAQLLRDLEHRSQQKGLVGTPSGITDLDRKTGGFQKTDLVILAGRPGMGKTGAAITFTLNGAKDFGRPIALFSLEMSADQMTKRLAAMIAGIDSEKMRTGGLTDSDWQRLQTAIEIMSTLPIIIDDTPGLSIGDCRAKIRRFKRLYGIETVIIDYLQLMTVGKDEQKAGNREQEISYISRKLKEIAKEADVCMLALAQLSRAVELRGGSKRPQLSDLRESGAIENDADIIIFVYRPEYYKIKEDEEGRSLKGIAEFIISKNRHGSLNTVLTRFEEAQTRFVELPFDSPFYNTGSTISAPTAPPPVDFTMPRGSDDDDIPF